MNKLIYKTWLFSIFALYSSQVMKQREVPHGYKAILKPDPEKSLKILDRFTLTADVDGAEICPEVWFEMLSFLSKYIFA